MSFIKKVAHYLNKSQEENIISEDQKKQILALIDSESSNVGFMKILSIIWVICVGIWVVLIIASNWSDFPRVIQLLLALMLPIVWLSIWYYFSYIQTELKILGNAFTLLWGILIGATIALIGQIYHLDGTVGSLTLMWFFLSLPLVFVFRFKTLAILSTALFYVTAFYYTTEVFFTSWREENYILATFSIISWLWAIWSYSLNSLLRNSYNYLLAPISVISLKILFFCLFLTTIEEANELMFLGDSFFAFVLHNILFLWTVLFVMWWSNKNHEILLRHSTFVWIGIYLIAKYLELFSWYLGAGIFFIVTGLFIIGLVYTFIKINNYLNKKSLNS